MSVVRTLPGVSRPLTPAELAARAQQRLNVAMLIGGLPGLALAIYLAVTAQQGPWFYPLAAGIFVLQAVIIFSDLRYGLALFILSAALSPRLPGLYDNLRVEDFVFLLCFIAWVLRSMGHRHFATPRSSLTLPFLLLTTISICATLYGLAAGVVPDWKYSVFIQVKRVEYFLIFWMVVTTVRSRQWVDLLLLVFIGSGALAALYGIIRGDDPMAVSTIKVTGPEGENYNTLCGYLVVAIAAAAASLLRVQERGQRFFVLACGAIMVVGLLLTYSREGYIMLGGTLLSLAFTRYRGLLLLLLAVLIPVLTIGPMRENLKDTGRTIAAARTDDPGSNSLTARMNGWRWRWNTGFAPRPIFGGGVGSVALTVDNEYLMRACEVGLVGLGFFLWLLFRMGGIIRALNRAGRDETCRVLGVALLGGFVGLLIQGTVAPAFTTVRTMEPFWFLLGLGWVAYTIARNEARAAAVPAAAIRPAGPGF